MMTIAIHLVLYYAFLLFVCVDSLRSGKQCFNHVGTGLPGLSQNKAEDIVYELQLWRFPGICIKV